MLLEPVIGLEVHAQLLTRSKMFCSCSPDYSGDAPNTHVCPVCLALPGILPVINKKAVEFTIMMGLALNCAIAVHTKFDRKNYPYPDLMKGYQISQFDMPIAVNGWLTVSSGKRLGITRVHMEEDTARLLHRVDPTTGEGYSLVDVNRSGVPLMEIVGEPDIASPEEAREYLVKLRSIVQFLGVSTANMEEGSFRCDANISMSIDGKMSDRRVEVKNMNSFRAVYRALQYEVKRQMEVLESGGRIVQETRGWLETEGVTFSQRSKEHAHDYRYFAEPDLPPLVIDRAWVAELQKGLPELPEARIERFQNDYGLSTYDAEQLVSTKAGAEFFEQSVNSGAAQNGEWAARAKATANWMVTELAHLLNDAGKEIQESSVTPRALSELLDLVDGGTISTTMAKDAFEEMFRTGKGVAQVVEEKGLSQISDAGELDGIVAQVVEQNPKAVADFRSGKETAVKFFVGQVMRATRGQANPQKATEAVSRHLGRDA